GDSRSRLLRCSPADSDVGSDRGLPDGVSDDSTSEIVEINSFIGCGACGHVGEGEHFPACRACSECGGSGAGRQRRSTTYPQVFFVNLPRRAIAEALVLTLLVVETEPGADASLRLGDRRIGVEIDLLGLETAPQPLDKDV